MSNKSDPEDSIERDKWIRDYYGIKNEATDAYLVRNGISADTPQGLVKRLNMALAWLWPQLTPRTRPIYEEIQAIVQQLHQKTSLIRPYEEGKPLSMAMELTELDTAKTERVIFLFEHIKELHRVEANLAAQEAFKRSQRARASKPRKLEEVECERIAKAYWHNKVHGGVYGIVKDLARQFNVSPSTIQATVKKYKPSIDK